MSYIQVKKSKPLEGSVTIHGAKNSALPTMAATLLIRGKSVIHGVPFLRDVEVMIEILEFLGVTVERKAESLHIDASQIKSMEAPIDLVSQMRASFFVAGPLLSRSRYAKLYQPGGCNIGGRPTDLHEKGFMALGALVKKEFGFIELRADELVGETIYLDFPSVGATENIMMAAVYAQGTTTIENAAEEPEIVDLANFINKAGGKIRGAGTKSIRITGVQELHPIEHTIIPDRIEAGTYMIAAAITKGKIRLENIITDHLHALIAKLKEVGCQIQSLDGAIEIQGPNEILPTQIKTMTHPGFPTDLQAPMMALLALAKGNSTITETVFENRFMHVLEMTRMGAKIETHGRTAAITGVEQFQGSTVSATDLRAGAALVLAGLAAEGETIVKEIKHIRRGYVGLVENLRHLGANIEEIDE